MIPVLYLHMQCMVMKSAVVTLQMRFETYIYQTVNFLYDTFRVKMSVGAYKPLFGRFSLEKQVRFYAQLYNLC
jgi:hypothetical protein